MIQGYYDLFDPAKHEDAILFRVPMALQARELNEVQSLMAHRITSIAGALFREGDVVDGAAVAIDPDSGAVTIEPGKLYLRGAVRPVDGAALTIPVVGRVALGVRWRTTVVTELEDPSLRSPEVQADIYQLPGAVRRVWHLAWGWDATGQTDGGEGEFHAVYTVTDGNLDNKTAPPSLDAVNVALARYDYEANGHYVISGLFLRFLSIDAGQHVFSLSAGAANVTGWKIHKPQDTRLRHVIDPDMQAITGEPHVFVDGGDGSMRVLVNRTPVDVVSEVRVTKEKTINLSHGGYSGATDSLPDATVVQVLSVRQGATVYTAGTDYTVIGDDISWAPTGAEPAPGSSYSVTYQYIATVAVTGVDDDGFTVAGVVPGSTLYVDYTWRLPRVDVVALDATGQVSRVVGIARTSNPTEPAVPAGLLALAAIRHDWRRASSPTITAIGTRVVTMASQEEQGQQIATLYDLVGQLSLKMDAQMREATVAKGLFVDGFTGDDMRDAGVVQTAAVLASDGLLSLPVAVEAVHMASAFGYQTLDYTAVPVLSQKLRTGAMKINPYQAFAPLPGRLTLMPGTYELTRRTTVWDAATTLFVGSGNRSRSSTQVALVSQTTMALQTLPEAVPVAFTLDNFGPGEPLASLLVDGQDLTPAPAPVANSAGVVTGSFTVPAGTPSGTKSLEFQGEGGSHGTGAFVAQPQLTTEVRREVTTVSRWQESVDPLAQTFTLTEAITIVEVDLWFMAVGSSDVVVQIRATQTGFPATTVLTEGRISAASIAAAGPTRIAFAPAALEAGVEYALVVMTDDATHAVGIAELGKYDQGAGTWVTAQAYQVGVLLSSSNARTWTAHQAADMTFVLYRAAYGGTSHEVTLATMNLANASDLVVFAGVDRPSAAADARFVLTAGATTVELTEGQPVNLPARLAGPATLKARLTGGGAIGPIVYPDVKLAAGDLQSTGTYVGRAFPADVTFDIIVVVEILMPTGASLMVEAEDGSAETWTALPFDSGRPVGDGWEERLFRATGLSGVGAGLTTRLRLTLAGTAAARPYVRKLRARVA